MVDANVWERIEELRRQKTSHSREEMSRLAWERYSEIKEEMEADHHGSFVMIEVDSGDYFVGSTSQDALQHALERYPEKAFYLIRIGYRTAGKLRVNRP